MIDNLYNLNIKKNNTYNNISTQSQLKSLTISLNTYFMRETIFWSALRDTPAIYNFYNILNAVSYPTSSNIYITSAYIVNMYTNIILKNSFKFLYIIFNNYYLPLRRSGSIYERTTNKEYFLKLNKPKSIIFGIPCGHSQNSYFMTTYLSFKMLESNYKIYTKFFSICSLLVLSSYVNISRIYIEKCHTWNQVLCGSLIGISLGYSVFIWEDMIIDTFNINS